MTPASPTDYGDYSSFANASSTVLSTLRIGALTDAETSATTDVNAQGDDTTDLADEDGVTLPAYLVQGVASSITVNTTNTTGATAYLNAWIDYNNNGVLTDAGEQIASNVNIITGTNGGTVNLNFNVPTNAVTAAALIGARFRLTNVTTPGSTGGVGHR